MQTLDYQILRQDWLDETAGLNGTSPNRTGPKVIPRRSMAAASWEPALAELVGLKDLGENWDGLGAHAPGHELLASAVGLANLLQERGMDPPCRVVPGVSGNVLFEWQDPDGAYCELDIDKPFHAEVMLIVPGEPAKHLEFPNA
jgi:hypothetical protein